MNPDRPEVLPDRHVALVGATASGKSAVAMDLARRLEGVEIVSVDSMQVYRGMDIGTAKPTPAEQAEVSHHLLDLADPWDDYDVARFQAAFRRALDEIEARGHRALLVGGTGLYHRAVIDDLHLPGRYPSVRIELEGEPDTSALYRRLAALDPVAAGRMEPTNRRRVMRALEVTVGSGRRFSSFGPGLDVYPPSPFSLVGLSLPVAELDRRIECRFAAQMEAGFLEEVGALASLPRPLSGTAGQALGYWELLTHLAGEVTFAEAVEQAVRRTRRFARRQRSWFARDPRIAWFDAGEDPDAVVTALAGHLGGKRRGATPARWENRS